MFNKILSLKRTDESETNDKIKQVTKLLTTFFFLLPAEIEEEGLHPQ